MAKPASPKRQPRWRVDEEIAAELAHTRRQSGCRSWNDFYRALLRQWREKPVCPPEPAGLKEIEAIVARHTDKLRQEFNGQLQAILSLVEAHSHVDETFQAGQERITALLQRIHDLLALVSQREEPSVPRLSFKQRMEERKRKAMEEAINQIRIRGA